MERRDSVSQVGKFGLVDGHNAGGCDGVGLLPKRPRLAPKEQALIWDTCSDHLLFPTPDPTWGVSKLKH